MTLKRTSILLISLLILTNVFWVYLIFKNTGDSIASAKYEELESYRNKNKLSALTRVCNKLVAGLSKEEAISFLREISEEQEPFEKEGYINTLWLSLKIDNQTGKISQRNGCEENA